MERLFGILDSDNSAQRQNAIAVISEILNTISSAENDLANTVRYSTWMLNFLNLKKYPML
jgi:hypothetical protein